jgi:hypothetical protein
MGEFPSHIREAMSICALRFDGYKFEESVGLAEPGSTGAGLRAWIEPIVAELTLHQDENRNLAAFFGLQRYLHKWGGEMLTKSSPEHIAYDFLFLHLYRQSIPTALESIEYCQQWQQRYAKRREEIAAYVRKSFSRQTS